MIDSTEKNTMAYDQRPPSYFPRDAPTISPPTRAETGLPENPFENPGEAPKPPSRAASMSAAAPAPSAGLGPAPAGPSKLSSRFHKATSAAGWPLNKAANLIGAEGWWPTSMEKECNKAARILHSFTTLGVVQPPKASGPMHPTGLTKKSLVKIPEAVLRNCAGLAIFNVLRAGAFHGSLAAGSGVVLARRTDGTWSPPSSFVVSTIGAGFMLGLDVYDCVCVLNTPAQVRAFTNPRVSLGGEASIAIGPVGTGGDASIALSKTARPIWSYMKSRGLWAGVSIEGTVMVSRADANAVFYNQRGISAKKILTGDVAWPAAGRPLFEVLKAMEGRPDFDRTVVQEVGAVPPPSGAYYGGVPKEEDTQQRQQQVPREEEAQDYYEDDTVMDEKERLRRAGF
jgi:lipid-binding SYLF domain-containing protein